MSLFDTVRAFFSDEEKTAANEIEAGIIAAHRRVSEVEARVTAIEQNVVKHFEAVEQAAEKAL